MDNNTIHNDKYRLYKTAIGRESCFIKVGDDESEEAFRNSAGNIDLLISTWYSAVPDISTPRNYSLSFHIVSNNPETARVSALELINYIEETYSIPDENIEIIYSGGSDNNPDAKEVISAVEIIILIPPVIFGGLPTPLMPALNYYLARQMVDEGLTNIEIDSYVRDSYIPLPNSINSATDKFVIRLTWKELIYLNGDRIVDLSKQPRPDDLIILQEVPEAVECFAEVHADFEKKLFRQDELQKIMLENGWQIPPCIRRLTWANLDRNSALEACRLIGGSFSFLGSHEEEIRYHVLRLARRNDITGFREHQKLKNIVTYGIENPMLAECQHPLLSRFCPTGGCYIAELIEEYEKPLLFE